MEPWAWQFASFGRIRVAGKASFSGTLGARFEEFVDEPILTVDAMPTLGPSELCASPHSPELFVAQPGIRDAIRQRSGLCALAAKAQGRRQVPGRGDPKLCGASFDAVMLLLFRRKLRIAILGAADLLLQLVGRFYLEAPHGGKLRLGFGFAAKLHQDLSA
jgi:hypothetical protein